MITKQLINGQNFVFTNGKCRVAYTREGVRRIASARFTNDIFYLRIPGFNYGYDQPVLKIKSTDINLESCPW